MPPQFQPENDSKKTKKEKVPLKRGYSKKGTVPKPKQIRRIEVQTSQKLDEIINELPVSCDAGYDVPEIAEISKSCGHVPVIMPNNRRCKIKRELDPAKKQRYRIRTTAERGFAALKDISA